MSIPEIEQTVKFCLYGATDKTTYQTSANPTTLKQLHSNFMTSFVDPRYEDEALSALMEEAFSETKEEKFDVESYLNGEIDYA